LNANSVPAVDPRKELIGYQAGQLVMELVRKNITPKQILTAKPLERRDGRGRLRRLNERGTASFGLRS